MKLWEREKLYGPTIAKIFREHGLPAEWGMAIARQETFVNPNLPTTMTGGDGRRGGSFGICQMSLMTAKDLGYTGAPEGLADLETNLNLAAKLVASLAKEYANNLQDIASAYNSGRPFAKAPNSTRSVYVPNVLLFAAHYKGLY